MWINVDIVSYRNEIEGNPQTISCYGTAESFVLCEINGVPKS